MLKLAEYFGDGMVLQRHKPIRLWGECDEEGKIQVILNGERIAEEKIEKGAFSFYISAQEATEDAQLTLKHEKTGEECTFTQVDIGEVWLAGGQSNMEFLLKYDKEAEETLKKSDRHLRFYDIGEWAYPGERELGLKSGASWDHWMEFGPDKGEAFSAVGTYFARRLRKELGVPVGIIGCNWGGTSASAWVPRSALEKDEVLKDYVMTFEKEIQGIDMKKYEESLKKPNPYASNPKVIRETEKRMKQEICEKPGLLTRLVGKLIVATSKMMPYSENRPGGLYEMMLKPVAGYTIAGFLWYQGESDYQRANVYDRLLNLLIRTWREDWREELPFLLVQLASYEGWPECSGENYHLIRSAQQKIADRTKKVYLASIMDVGSRYDIHPKEKRPVGERLAALALCYVYGKKIPCEAPRIEKVTREEGKLRVRFAYAESGLVAKGDISSLFKVEVSGKKVPVRAYVQKDCVILEGEGLKAGKARVSFAYRPWCPMTLFNGEGLAARPCEPVCE